MTGKQEDAAALLRYVNAKKELQDAHNTGDNSASNITQSTNSSNAMANEDTQESNSKPTLFEPEECRAYRRNGLTLETDPKYKAIPKIDKEILVDPDRAIVATNGEVWLIPNDIAEAMKTRSFVPESDRVTVDDGAYTDDEWVQNILPDGAMPEDQLLEHIATGRPGYYLTMKRNGKTVSYPVYGYMADLGKRAAASPIVDKSVANDWDDCEWLCRCAQCGRELPPSYFYVNTSGRAKGICRGCTSINRTADKLYKTPRRYWLANENKFMVSAAILYNQLWGLGLSPRGEYCEHLLGRVNIRSRIAATKFTSVKHATESKYKPERTRSIPKEQIDKQLRFMESISPNLSKNVGTVCT